MSARPAPRHPGCFSLSQLKSTSFGLRDMVPNQEEDVEYAI